MRAVVDGAPLDQDIVRSMASCVQCRGCEPACPSGVPFGELIAETRSQMQGRSTIGPRWLGLALGMLRHPALVRSGSRVLAALQRFGLVPSKRLGLPHRLPLRDAPLEPTGNDVWLFTGCVQDAWLRSTHRAAMALLAHAGVGAEPTGDRAPCCGALHHHAGFDRDARSLAQSVIDRLGTDRPVVVDAAGCGAALKEYGRLLGTPQAIAFSAGVFDIAEFVAPRIDSAGVEPLDLVVAVQDPCHLRHVQGSHQAVRDLLAPLVRSMVELNDDGLCCGAGGAFAVVEPTLAVEIRDRKLDHIAAASPDVVASANPGCGLHLAAAGVTTRHPVELAAQALGLDTGPGLKPTVRGGPPLPGCTTG